MNCTQAQQFIHSRLDNELSIDDAIRLGEHFALCSDCKTLAADLDKVCGVARTLPAIPRENSIASRFAAQLAHEQKRARARWRWLAWTPLAAAACIFIILNVWHRSQDRQDKVVQSVPPAEKEAPPPAEQKLKAPKEEHFDAAMVVSDLYVFPENSPSAAELQERELLQKLSIKGKAGEAARKLALEAGDAQSRAMWSLTMAVRDPAVDAEVFQNISELKPQIKLAPVYIAALDSARNRKKALELLRSISRTKLAPEPQLWVDWLRSVQQDPSKRKGT
jgi:hypothetical protein